MTKNKPPVAYEVGYGRPPQATRWKKGVSGNPSGRPKKKTSIDDLLDQEFNKKHRIVEDGVQKHLIAKEIIAKRLCMELMKEKSVKTLQKALKIIKSLEERNPLPEDGIPRRGVLVVTGTLSEEEWEKQSNEFIPD